MSEKLSQNELKSVFAAADHALKAPVAAPSGQTPTNASQSQQKNTFARTLPREQLPPLAVRPGKKNFVPLYRLGWMYTLREFVERIMKGNPHANRVASFEKNVQDPFEAKYPKFWLPNFTLNYSSNTVIVYITTNIDERTLALALDQKLVDAAKDILGQDKDPQWHIQS